MAESAVPQRVDGLLCNQEFSNPMSGEPQTEFWLIELEEKTQLPNGYNSLDYESKRFIESKSIQDFPLRGKAVYLRIRKRRWRHKRTREIII
ncbi:MAG: hypothetical protein ORN54_04535 [Cyclobacteriaceae bacterium]|nr:hypothetical protein [Cyclobacteriaceae bacterium]